MTELDEATGCFVSVLTNHHNDIIVSNVTHRTFEILDEETCP